MKNLSHILRSIQQANNPMKSIQQFNYSAITDAGFVTPPVTFRKVDNRGAEYGYHEVTVIDAGHIKVDKVHPTEWSACYTFHFLSKGGKGVADLDVNLALGQFLSWAREET